VPEAAAELESKLGIFAEELSRLDRRLRGLSAAAWRSRSGAVRQALEELARVDAHARRDRERSLPDLMDYALADALLVIGADVLEALSDNPQSGQIDLALSISRRLLDESR
jgi:hypothetical protein